MFVIENYMHIEHRHTKGMGCLKQHSTEREREREGERERERERDVEEVRSQTTV